MRQITISNDIVPLAEFKAKLSAWIKKLKASKRPLILTQNGKAAAVIILPEEYDKLTYNQNYINSVKNGLADIKNNDLLLHTDVIERFEQKFGEVI